MTALVMPPLPAPPSPPPRTPFPVIAVIAPAVGAIVILLITGSVFVLVFAALSPLIAIATALDARRTARRHVREEAARFDRDCSAWLARVPELHDLERARADAAHPPLHERLRARDPGPEPDAPIRVGLAPAPSAIAPDRPPVLDDGPVAERLAGLVAAASAHPGLPVLVSAGTIRVVGRGRAADALARLLSLHPSCDVERDQRAPSAAVGDTIIPGSAEIVVESPTRARVRRPDGSEIVIRPEGATRREHDILVRRRAPVSVELPTGVRWAEIADEGRSAGIAPGAIGVDADGVVELDLLGDAPHALVGGTTGSGKSELLRTIALGWAAGGSPSERSVLLVDFKGGAAFAELAALPHVAGLLTDLDAASAQRALRSLRAEIRRREATLLEAGARDIIDLPTGGLARLLILVDEYAVLVESFPELQPLIADLAARGRSLGIHLVLCTQRPGGVVRDSVASNCGVRIAFRMADASDATGLLAVPPPAQGAPAGRAILSSAGRSRAIQIATIDAADLARAAARWHDAPRAPRPWLPPLPSGITRAEASALASDIADQPSEPRDDVEAHTPVLLGVLDDPDRQRRLRGHWVPARDGALLVVGARGSGTVDALAVIAESAALSGFAQLVVPSLPADAIGMLAELRDELDDGARGPVLLIVPEIDALVAECGDRSLELLEAVDALDRRVRRGGGALVASCSSVLRARSGVVGRFDSIVLLRAASADDHRAAGGAPSDFDGGAPRGRGQWQGRVIQLLQPERPLPAPRSPRIPDWSPAPGSPVAIVSPRPVLVADRLRRAGLPVALDPAALGTIAPTSLSAPTGRTTIAVGDPESWQTAWTALAVARREGAIVLVDTSESDARTILGHRAVVPLRDEGRADEVIVVDARGPIRARWAAVAAPSESDDGRSRGAAVRPDGGTSADHATGCAG